MAEENQARNHAATAGPLFWYVPWSGVEILAVFFVSMLWPTLLYHALLHSGWYAWFYGPDFFENAQAADPATQNLAFARLFLWAGCAAMPLQVLSALGILYLGSGTRPAEVGLTHRRLGRNVGAGLLAAGVLIPGVYAIQWLVLQTAHSLHWKVQDHPLTKLGQLPLHPVEWVLIVIAATVCAPVWEELFFRGIVQPWVMTRPWGGRAALLGALALTLITRLEAVRAAAGQGMSALLVALVPVLVLLGLVPVYLLLERRSRVAGGLFASAVLFAWVHAGSAWPSPIPLLWLALGLSWLAWRTRSLVAPMVLHAVFNGVACIVLFWRPPNHPEADGGVGVLVLSVCWTGLLYAGTFRGRVC